MPREEGDAREARPSREWLDGALEAMLFVTDEAVDAASLAKMTGVETSEAAEALRRLSTRFEQEGRGIQLREVAGGWRLLTHPAYHGLIEKYVLSWDTRKLSAAATEALAIVAYLQPVTRAGIADVRGVNSDSVLNSLVEKGLVREVGTADTPGNPALYGTTRVFLEKFGLRTPADLPPLEDFAPDEETRRLIRERLGAPRAGGDDVNVAPAGEGALQVARRGDTHVAPDRAEDGAAEAPGAAGASLFFAPADDATRGLLNDAMASALGLVEKINFDELRLDTDDE